LAALFKRAIADQPSIIFIDELDAILSGGTGDSDEDQHTTGRKLLSQLMMEFDKLHQVPDSRVLVIGATNCPGMLDTALLRFGRFEQQVAVLPEPGYRVPVDMILRELGLLSETLVEPVLLKEKGEVLHCLLESILAGRALSGAQVVQVVADAKRIAMRKRLPVSLDHFKIVLQSL
jgi:SpoVK/Ycf46/Vps4 family AAA+-type ATPase